jgi:hypothetical protein
MKILHATHKTLVYVALAGEYEVAFPLGVFSDLKKAKKCIEDSNPSCNTEVLAYNIKTGLVDHMFTYQRSYDEVKHTFGPLHWILEN